MRTLLASCAVLLGACGAPAPLITAERIANGGAFDLQHCSAPIVALPVVFTRSASTAAVALAVCGDLRSDNTTTVVGDVRVSETLRVSSPVNVSGSLFVGGVIDASNTLQVQGDLFGGADWNVSSPNHITGDATIAGGLRHDNTVGVGGLLTVAAESGPGALEVGRLSLSAPVVDAPLRCDAAPDVHAIAESISDSDRSIEADALLDVRSPTELTLGCGVVALSGLEANNTLTVHVVGPTRLVIHGRMHVASPVVFDLSRDGSLELIVDGPLDVDNTLTIGDAAHASLVAVSGAIRIAAPMHLDGVLIAPRSSVAGDNTLTINGSAFIGPLRVASPLNVHPGARIGVDGWPITD